MKSDFEKIRGTVKRLNQEYNFRGPLHFTDFSNLKSIISIGYLLSRDLCYANNIEFYDAGNHEVINNEPSKVRGCTRFYYVEKNDYDVMKNLDTPVYLIFSEDIIYLDLAIYTDGSADFFNTNYGTDYDFFNYDIDWEVVFNKRDEAQCFTGPVKEIFCSKRQSELLVDEPVPLIYLKNIVFRCYADYKRACNLFGKNKMYQIDPNMFISSKDYIIDYNIIYNKSSDKDVFVLHFSSSNPVKNDDKHEYKLYDMDDNELKSIKVNYSESESTDFHIEVTNLPCLPVKFKFWFYGVLSIEETIG